MKRILLFLLLLSLTITSWAQNFKAFAPTPPMGWNSYDCYGLCADEQIVRANADYMAKNLKKYGWEYIVIDARWFQDNNYKGYSYVDNDTINVHWEYNIDKYGRLIPGIKKFPSSKDAKGFKPLIDELHAKGLKFGLHLMRGVPKKSVLLKTPIKGLESVTADMISTGENACSWSHDSYQINLQAKGAQEYYNSVFDLFASWGVDFVKVDDISCPYSKQEIEMVRKAIDQCGRNIVLSLSPGATPLSEAKHVAAHANMWRIVGDLWDSWGELKSLVFVTAKWTPYIEKGAWPDCDMMPLGRIVINQHPIWGSARNSKFTHDEQELLVNLYCIAKSPMMFGGDMTQMDSYTYSLLTNKAMLKIHSESINNRVIRNDNNVLVWTADAPHSHTHYLAVFNVGNDKKNINISLDCFKNKKKYKLVNLWTNERSCAESAVQVDLLPHQSIVYKIQ